MLFWGQCLRSAVACEVSNGGTSLYPCRVSATPVQPPAEGRINFSWSNSITMIKVLSRHIIQVLSCTWSQHMYTGALLLNFLLPKRKGIIIISELQRWKGPPGLSSPAPSRRHSRESNSPFLAPQPETSTTELWHRVMQPWGYNT